MKFFSTKLQQFYDWFDALSKEHKFLSFVAAVFGWIPFMFGNLVAIWVVGYVWMTASAIFLLTLYLRA